MRDGVMRQSACPARGFERRLAAAAVEDALRAVVLYRSFRLRRCLEDADAIIFNHVKHA